MRIGNLEKDLSPERQSFTDEGRTSCGANGLVIAWSSEPPPCGGLASRARQKP